MEINYLNVTVHLHVCLVLVLLVFIAEAGNKPSGGRCLQKAQHVCAKEMSNLIEEETGSNRRDKICKYFGVVHSCMLKVMSSCPYKTGEKKLYDMDIVNYYTNDPYRCALIGGNLAQRGPTGPEDKKPDTEGNKANKTSFLLQNLILVTLLIYILH